MRLPAIPVPLPVMRGVLGARRRMLDLADAGLPGGVGLFDLTWGLARTKIAGTLVTSGLADALGKDARDPVELAHELGFDPDVTTRLIEAAVASRLMRLDRDGRARLTKIGAPLCTKHPYSICSWAAFIADPDTAAAIAHLDGQAREGAQPSGYQRAFGKSVWEYFGERPAAGARFAEAMRQMTALDLPATVRAYPWPRRGVICDVGGGIGHLLAGILDRRPGVRGILLDSPEVIKEAEGFLRERGLADRIDCREGDFFGELDARADVYTMKWILHDWSDDACRDILTRVRAIMPSGSKLVTIDLHREPGRPNSITSMMDLGMLVICEGGRERSPQEVHGLMRDVGLTPGRVRHSGLMMLVEGVAP
jgi:O-methyltransferase domain